MKFIITIEDDISPEHGLYLVGKAVNRGMVSLSGKSRIPTYCFVTTFTDGSVVIARDRATTESAHSFIVRKEEAATDGTNTNN